MSTTGKKLKKITILQSHDHELYLPLHYAVKHNFWGWTKDITVEVETVKVESEVGSTQPNGELDLDHAVYEKMMKQNRDTDHNIYMAITDPFQIFDTYRHDPVLPAVLAIVVNNGGFWVVTKREYAKKENDYIKLANLAPAFQEIIAYKEGSTSHRIAQRIVKSKEKIEPVSQGDEISTIINHGTNSGEHRDKAIALSPNILDINRKEDLLVLMSLHSEFKNVVACALIGRSDIVDEYESTVGGIVMGIEFAIVKIKNELKTSEGKKHLVEFIKSRDYWTKGTKDNDNTTDGSDSIVKTLGDINFDAMPDDVIIDESVWMTTAENGFGFGKQVNIEQKANYQQLAMEYFRKCIKPYTAITAKSNRPSIVSHVFKDSNKDSNTEIWTPSLSPIFFYLTKRLKYFTQDRVYFEFYVIVTGFVLVLLGAIANVILDKLIGYKTTWVVMLVIAVAIGSAVVTRRFFRK